MDKSVLVKMVWCGAVLAIPAAILAVQKPQVSKVDSGPRRAIAVDRPVTVDLSTHQIQTVKPLESAPAAEPLKPKAVWLAAEKITSKGGSPAQEPASAKEEPPSAKEEPASAKQEPAPAKQEPASAKQEPAPPKAGSLVPKDQNLASALAGPHAAPAP